MADREQLIMALKKADAAGDVGAAKAIARRIKSIEQQDQKPIDPTIGMSGYDTFMSGVGGGFEDIKLRARQLAGQDVAAEVDKKRKLDEPLNETALGGIGRGTAYAAPVLLAPFTVGGALASGSAMGALEPLGSDEDFGDVAENMTKGGLSSLAGLIGGKALSKMVAPLGRTVAAGVGNLAQNARTSEPYQQAVALLQKHGVPLNAAQTSGNESLKNLWRSLANNPVTAGFVQGDRLDQSQALNKAAGRYFGKDIKSLTHDDLVGFLSDEGAKIGSITESIPRVDLGKLFMDDLAKAEAPYQSVLPTLQNTQYPALRDELLNRVMTQDLSGKMAQESQRVIREMSESGGAAKEPLRRLRKALNNSIDNATPNSAALKDARKNYAILKQFMPDAGVIGVTNEGNIIPSRIANRMKGKTDDLAKLMRSAQTVLPEISSSNTAGQQMWNQILQGGIANMGVGTMAGAGAGYMTGGDLNSALKGAAAGATPKLAYKALSTPIGAKWLEGAGRNWMSPQAEKALQKLFMSLPVAAASQK